MRRRIVAIFLIITLVITSAGCGTEIKKSDDVEVMALYKDNRTGVCEGEDGWMYIADIYKSETGAFDYHIDAYNYKYQYIENCGIRIIQDDPEDVTIIPENPSSKGLTLEGAEEMDKIEEYLNDMQYNREITEKHLEGLELECFKKEYIVEAFNNALKDKCWLSVEKNMKAQGEYPFAYTIHKRLSDGSRLSIGYCDIAGTIKYVYAGLEYKDGTFLKDNIANGTATKKEKKIYKIFKKIEETYVEKNSFDIKGELEDMNWNESEIMKNLSEILDEYRDKTWSLDWEV